MFEMGFIGLNRMDLFKFSLFLLILQVVAGFPNGIMKRAHILPPKSPNITDTQPRKQNTDVPPVNKTTTLNATKEELCPSHLVPHNVSDRIVCCVPYFNCGIDHGIKVCGADGEIDQCVPCPPGMVQKNNVSSLNMEEAECYTERNTENCPLDDTKPSRKVNVVSCLLKCECQNENCWYGRDPCACSLNRPCQLNYTMNRDTGACEPCPMYSYKDYVGCGTCTVVPELWAQRFALPPTAEPEKKTVIEETSKTPNDIGGLIETNEAVQKPTQKNEIILKTEKKANEYSHILIGVLVAALIVLVVSVIIFVCVKKRYKHTGSSSQLLTHAQTKPAGQYEDIELREIPDGYKIVGKQKPEHVSKKAMETHELRYEELGAVGGVDMQVEEEKVPNENFEDYQEKVDEPHEEMPLLTRNPRHGHSHTHMQNASNPDLGVKADSSGDVTRVRSPLQILPLDAKGGARPKVKSESTLLSGKGAISYKQCTFKNCNFTNHAIPVFVSPELEDSSLCTTESSNFTSIEPEYRLPIDIEASPSRREGTNDAQNGCRGDRKYHGSEHVQDEFPLNIETDGACSSENNTTDNNCTMEGEDKLKNDSEFELENKLGSLLEAPPKLVHGNNPVEEAQKDRKVESDATESKISGGGMDNYDDQRTASELSLNDSITARNTSKDLKACVIDRKPDTDTERNGRKNLSIELSKADINNKSKDGNLVEPGSGKTSPTSSGSESDENKASFGAKRKIKPFNSNENGMKPTARIEPIQLNSVQEPRQEFYQDALQISPPTEPSESIDHQGNIDLYTATMSLDSYPFLHASRDAQDVANQEDFNSLDTGSIERDQSSVLSCENSITTHVRDSMCENCSQSCTERMGPEGCSLPHSCSETNYVERPDLQRTYSKTVEENGGMTLTETVARNLSGETFPKTLNDDSRSKHEPSKVSKNTCIDEDLEEIEKENTKQSEAVRASEQDCKTVIKSVEKNTDCDVESTDTKDAKNGIETADCVNDIDTGEEADTSVEVPIDCLDNDIANASYRNSVEISGTSDDFELRVDDTTAINSSRENGDGSES